jgi:ABC-type bacteriocin/lantibiotic exporter with double-glycine peptidase domain
MVKILYRYIWKISARDQVILSILSIGVFLLELVPLELQRRMVNAAVNHGEFRLILILGGIYLGVALLHGGLKLVTNVYRGSVSESTNKHLRMQVRERDAADSASARRPDDHGVRISIIVSEVEAVGSFAGSSFSEPVLNAGILLSVFGYMLYTQPWLAMVAIGMFLPQLLFIPALQEAINRRTERRIETLRALSADIVNEATSNGEARSHSTFRRRVGFVYLLNMQIFIRKFGINFLMNLLYTLGVIGILCVGGWLVLQEKTEVGTIVAFISGLARMNAPWRDLMNWFRDLTNAGTKYRLIAEQLEGAG